MMSFFDAVGGRKFLACLIALVIGVIFFALGRIEQAGFIDLLKWTVVIYIGGNVASDVAAIFQARPPQT